LQRKRTAIIKISLVEIRTSRKIGMRTFFTTMGHGTITRAGEKKVF
jgi:hypothetical protein